MLNRKVSLLSCLVLLCAISCGCTRDEFTVKAHFEGLGSQNVAVVYASDEGVQEYYVLARDGRLEFSGHAPRLTVLSLLDAQRRVLLHTAVSDGDELVIEGNVADLARTRVDGNEVARQWAGFVSANAELYKRGDAMAVDAAVERYVSAHPDSVSSALLLLCEHSDLGDVERVERLLTSLTPSARPPHLLAQLEAVTDRLSLRGLQQSQMTLVNESGEFAPIYLPATGRLLLTVCTASDRATLADSLRDCIDRWGGEVLVIDVSVDPDTSTWLSSLRRQPISGTHCWAPGGLADISLSPLRIRRTPFFVVNDSTGQAVYSGSNVGRALAHLP